MRWWDEHVLPRGIELACGSSEFHRWRARVLDGIAGRVVEIGFGTGHSLQHYPEMVTQVMAVEPSLMARDRAQSRIDHGLVPVEFVGLDAGRLPIESNSCDAAVCMFTMCTVPDPALALGEIRRVLRPQGMLHVLEHGAAIEAAVRTTQQRFEPLQRAVAGGCHLTRDPFALAQAAGFHWVWTANSHARGPKAWTYLYAGVAVVSTP